MHRFDMAGSRLVLVWGKDIHFTQVTHMLAKRKQTRGAHPIIVGNEDIHLRYHHDFVPIEAGSILTKIADQQW
jgi:hypothetical protein